MRRLKIIAVGKMKNKALAHLCGDYLERLSHYCRAEIAEIGDSDPEREGERMLAHLKNFKGKVYAAGEEGRLRTSREFARLLEGDAGDCAFLVGGAYGLSAEVKARADEVISLSPMTFTHEFARAILLEQLYRAKNISANTGYHH